MVMCTLMEIMPILKVAVRKRIQKLYFRGCIHTVQYFKFEIQDLVFNQSVYLIDVGGDRAAAVLKQFKSNSSRMRSREGGSRSSWYSSNN